MMPSGSPAQSDPRQQRYLKYPLDVGGASVLVTTTADDHLRDLILEVLLTNPGERINLPEFGAGVSRLVFEPANEALRASAQFLIATGLQQWLGDRIDVASVDLTSEPGDEETITIAIAYVVKTTQTTHTLAVQL